MKDFTIKIELPNPRAPVVDMLLLTLYTFISSALFTFGWNAVATSTTGLISHVDLRFGVGCAILMFAVRILLVKNPLTTTINIPEYLIKVDGGNVEESDELIK